MGKLLPILLILAGLGAGVGAGLALRPAPPVDAAPDPEAEPAPDKDAAPPEFAKLNNQFVVPVVENNRIASLVILSLSVEVAAGNTAQVYAQEPKLRDALLQHLFDHANTGGFRGSFTDADNLILLRKGLTEIAQSILGDMVRTVLITDIVRQDG